MRIEIDINILVVTTKMLILQSYLLHRVLVRFAQSLYLHIQALLLFSTKAYSCFIP